MGYSTYNKRRFQGDKPVNEGDIYDLEIEGIGTKGDGIGKIKGFVVIVPGVKVGEKVKVKITAVRGKVAFGEVAGKADSAPKSKDKKKEVPKAKEEDKVSDSEDEDSEEEVSESEDSEEEVSESEDSEEEVSDSEDEEPKQ